jgi:hypothetical protein
MTARAAAFGTKTSNNNAREVRNLANLSETASTSRVLNLSQIYSLHGREAEYAQRPFFRDATLNKALIIKHTLRANERELFPQWRRTATKIILPFDSGDLRLGGRSIFINQMGFDAFARGYFNTDNPGMHEDVQILRHLDTIPSLDPFLVREHLARFGFRPAPCYLKISQSDLHEMINFTNEEIQRLVLTACGAGMETAAMRLTAKILANDLDSDLDALKQTFRMTDEEFSEGMFSWRGFLYFKWRQTALLEEIRRVVEGLGKYRPIGVVSGPVREYIEMAKPTLSRKIIMAILNTRKTLNTYDEAYSALVEGSNPGPFRQFLLDGPAMFFDLGESIGILGHIGSFWGYRMGPRARLSPEEFADVLADFEDSLMNIETGDGLVG